MKQESIKFTEEFHMSVKHYYSYTFFQAASLFSREAFRIRDECNNSKKEKMNRDYRSNVLGCLIFSVTFLESTINEFYDSISTEAVRKRQVKSKSINYNLYKKLDFLWNNDKIRNFSILDKFQLALNTFEKNIFDTGENPFQDIQTLISFRNYLIHFKPELIEIPIDKNEKALETSVEKK
jgi:hypothetical protein